jgi:hypothetical protein
MQEIGDINYYRCKKCRGYIKTVHVDAGVTPMMLGCRAFSRCSGYMISAFYVTPPPPVQTLLEQIERDRALDGRPFIFEWYKPTKRQLRKEPDSVKEYVKMGGLLLREKKNES